MRAGRLDEPITIESLTTTQDSEGGVLETWATFVKTRAEVVEMTAAERFRSDYKASVTISRFFTRYHAGVTAKMRINYNSRLWRITGIREINRRRKLEFTAEVIE